MRPIATMAATPRRSRSSSIPHKSRYRELLELFFQIHDPTTKNRQGGDVGSSYRSAIFYVDDEQRQIAKDTIADVEPLAFGPDASSPRSSRQDHSGRPSPSIRTISSATRMGIRAISRGRTGCSRTEVTPSVADDPPG